MIVVFSAASKRDLVGISRYLAEDNPGRARIIVEGIRSRATRLGDFPRSCPAIADPQETGLRQCVVGRYSIFYRVENDRVEVVRVLHSSRDIARLLTGDLG